MRVYTKVYITIITIALFALFAISAFAQANGAYVTPDSWSNHITANGIKASSKGLNIAGANLKLGLTTRAQFRFNDDNDTVIYQYARARLSGLKVANGEININLNARGAWDSKPRINAREYYVNWDGLDVSRDRADFDFRLYTANIELNKIIPYTDITLGRLYLPLFDSYKIDGGNIAVSPFDWLKVNVFYGLPVSYYSGVNTQVVGGGIDIPIEKTNTRVRAEYSFFMNDSDYLETQVLKGRIDQKIYFVDIYLAGSMIGRANTYEAGFNSYYDKTRTGLSAYIKGQYDHNRHEINPYVGLFETVAGQASQYFMGGFEVTQGITNYVMLAVGFEGRYNMDEAYGDRDYYRVFGQVDLVGLLHRNNYISIIADYYTIAKYQRQDCNSKLLFGVRMTQKVLDNLELWLGTNVQNYQYHASPIKYYYREPGFSYIDQQKEADNTTLAYIGGMWQPTTWCALQLDYTFEYSDIFKKIGFQKDTHTLEAWANFLW